MQLCVATKLKLKRKSVWMRRGQDVAKYVGLEVFFFWRILTWIESERPYVRSVSVNDFQHEFDLIC